jgi:dihydroxyacetone kinase DhaKLM complex PTS-EIIA-like component DhaM
MICEVKMKVYSNFNRMLPLLVFLLSAVPSLHAGSVRLNWQPNTELDLKGYNIYQGTQTRVYSLPIQVGKVDTYEFSDLQEGQTYYFAVTALDNSGNESGYSTEVSKQVPVTEDLPPVIVIKTPVEAATYSTDNPTVTIAGSANDDRGLKKVAWQNSTGGSGAANGTANWSIDAVALREGQNIITVAATDDAGNEGQAVIAVTYTKPAPQAPSVPVTKITTSADDGNVGSNTIDNSLETRWSAIGNEQWIQYDLGKPYAVKQLAIAFFKGNERQADFEIRVSDDAKNWSNVLRTRSSGATLQQENFAIADATGRYVRIVGYGNSKNNWNSITEVDIVGMLVTAPDVTVPIVGILSPVEADTYSTDSPIVTIAGNASDDRGLQKVAWRNSTGGSGEANGTAKWSIDAVALTVGQNIITVTATDDAGNEGQAVITVTRTKPSPTATSVPVVTVTTSDDDGNIGSNTIDNSLETRWSAIGSGQWIQYDLGKSYAINQLSIAFFKGNQRQADFEIRVSEDAKNWSRITRSLSSGATLQQEKFDIAGTTARYVRIVGYGNSKNNWNSITEVDIVGNESVPTDPSIAIATVTTSSDDGNVGSNSIDGNLATRWSAMGHGEWIQYDLGASHTITQLAIAFYRGDQRIADFEVRISEDGILWDTILDANSSGSTSQPEIYSLPNAKGRYLRLVGFGNSVNTWNSITEVDIIGDRYQYASY